MAIQTLTCANIGGLDNGLFGRIVDEEIARIVSDLDDRGHDGNGRSLLIQIDFKMDVSRDPKAPAIHIDPQVKTKLPPKRSGVTIGKCGVESGDIVMLFRDDNSENPDQGTIYDDADAKDGNK